MKLDRLIGMLTVLLQKERVTAPQLAERFEVSSRTIRRDIETLCMAGIPIITQQGVGGGISIAEGFRLDKTVLTNNELTDIIAALKGIGSVTNQTQIKRTLNKIGANSNAVLSLREPVVIDLASHYEAQLTDKIDVIKKAVLHNKIIEFDYFYEKGEVRKRIEPYFVIFQWSAWYVFGFCLERKDWRTFKLTRLWNLVTSDEEFSVRDVPEEKRTFGAHLTDEINLVALFDKSVKHCLVDAYGLDSYMETEEGLWFSFGFTNRGFLVSWLLGFGGKVKVFEPKFIEEDLKDAAVEILARYSGLKPK